MTDPYRHHPELRGQITPPEESFFFDFDPASLDDVLREIDSPLKRYEVEQREAVRSAALQRRPAGDLWVFGYGSLMWDPGFRFSEVRHGQVSGYRRGFCMVDTVGARGTPGKPGLQVALMEGGRCDGLVYRIAEAAIEDETQRLFNREAYGPGYVEVYVVAETKAGPVTALAFLGDTRVSWIQPDLPRETALTYAAHGEGVLGTSWDYLDGMARKFRQLRIVDPEIRTFHDEVAAIRAVAATEG